MTEHRLLKENLSLERLDGEVVAIDFVTGRFYSFEGPGADVVHLLEQGIARSRWEKILHAHYQLVPDSVPLEQELSNFINQMVDNQLLAPTELPDTPDAPLPSDVERGVWSSPTFMVNNELVELIVIDPIHESNEYGWPQKKP